MACVCMHMAKADHACMKVKGTRNFDSHGNGKNGNNVSNKNKSMC